MTRGKLLRTGSVVVLALASGCGRAPAPAPAPGASGEDTAAFFKGVEETISSGGGASFSGGGVANFSSIQFGTHRLITRADVSVTTVTKDETVNITLGKQSVAVAFDKGTIVVDGTERGTLPAATKVVDVEFLAGKLTVKADGITLPLAGATPAR